MSVLCCYDRFILNLNCWRLYCIVMFCIVSYCNVLHCVVLQCTALYSYVLYFIVVFIHRRLEANGTPVGPARLNILPSDSVEYDDDDDNSVAPIQVCVPI